MLLKTFASFVWKYFQKKTEIIIVKNWIFYSFSLKLLLKGPSINYVNRRRGGGGVRQMFMLAYEKGGGGNWLAYVSKQIY